ncbi:ribosomal protein S16 [Basidiobolus meristosporus CBS 931.73]|uniref:Ribosomal protein S16 n=1 Tax=Basidiobolus meristosporus CBS 931.73 TaxID=1314790 RepID=A0A1Y1XTA5_9FUNG|nr:ribosomal protein S16 [Basidiobolus meristosporus CBS 931.73]|eukprot:ORX88997.1 ribosomal protein S16 [Basidiobolus meristosporus CBS 931.73]
MVVRIRLTRLGRKNLPFYHLVVANARSPRDRRHLEHIGTYNPLPDNEGVKHVSMNMERVKYWLSVGAQPSDPVQKLLSKAGIIPSKPKPTPKNSGTSGKVQR